MPDLLAAAGTSATSVKVNGTIAAPRDGVAITGEAFLSVTALDDAELVLVDSR